jgi:tetratricopeptide (TPR) repeat protein
MFNLIVPPIAIVVVVVLLIIFLAKVSPHLDDRKKNKFNKVNEKENFSLNVNSVSMNLEEENYGENFQSKDDLKIESEKIVKDELKLTNQDKFSKFKDFFSKFNFFDKFDKKKDFIKQKSQVKDKVALVNNIKNRVTSIVSGSFNNANGNSNKGQVSRMGEILLNNKNNSNNFSVAINEESELVKQISLDPKNPESYRRLGDFYVKNDRLQDARECYKYVLRLDPRHKRAQLAMARLDRILA